MFTENAIVEELFLNGVKHKASTFASKVYWKRPHSGSPEYAMFVERNDRIDHGIFTG